MCYKRQQGEHEEFESFMTNTQITDLEKQRTYETQFELLRVVM